MLILFAMIMGLSSLGSYKNTMVSNKKHPIYNVETQEKKLCITFDMNWGNDHTKEILDILDKYNMKATFFVIGSWISYDKENENLIKEISQRGHTIGNHSNSHADFTKISRDKIKNEIDSTDEKIKNITGKDTILFRFPSGAYNDVSLEQVWNNNHIPIQWDVDSVDWKEQGEEIEFNRVIKKVKPGSIILFHNNAKHTPRNLEKIIKKFQGEGYEFIKVEDLIYKEDFYIDSNGKQINK